MEDSLHVAEQTGVSAYIVANCLVTICLKKAPLKQAIEKKLDTLFGEIVELQKDKPLNEINKLELKWIDKVVASIPTARQL